MAAINHRALATHHRDLLRGLGSEIRRMREDAGRSQRWLAEAAGIARSHLGEIELGAAEPGLLILERIAQALGADLSVRLFQGTGTRARDRIQLAMARELLAVSSATWASTVEVAVYRPVHGVIDVVLDERAGDVTVASEIHSQLRRVEQQVRWQQQKADALAVTGAMRDRRVSRLVVVRNTRAMRDIVREAGPMLAAAYPARTADAVDALRGGAPWPGSAIAWMDVERGAARLLAGPPRGIVVGR